MDVFSSSDSIMCPAPKANISKQETQSREGTKKDPNSHDQRFLSNLPSLLCQAEFVGHVLISELPLP